MTQVISEAQLKRVIGYDRHALQQVEKGYSWLQTRQISMPPVFHIDIDPQSAVDVKGAYVEGLDAFAIKMASGFYGNAEKGLESSSSVILLISARTGFCEAVFLDNGYLMNLRTALAGAIATDHLARRDATTAGIVGTGIQARAQLRALSLVRDIKEVLVWGRDHEKAEACVADMRSFTSAVIKPCGTLETLVRQSEIIVTTTQASQPLIDAAWVQPGTHLTAMGSDLPGKQELSAQLLQQAELVVCDSISQCRIGGELQHVDEAKMKTAAVELSELVCKTHPGRSRDADVTVCDQTGLGVLDTAIALAAFQSLA